MGVQEGQYGKSLVKNSMNTTCSRYSDIFADLSSENEDETESEAAEGASGTDQSECCAEQQPEGQMYDHIHQIFITKNAVLCSEVQKNFRELSHADDLMRDHVAREEENIPYRLQDVDDYLYPLFLTSRQLMLMLDASLGSPYFFERKEDGSLKVWQCTVHSAESSLVVFATKINKTL